MQNKSRKNNKKFLVIIAMILMIGLVSGMGAMTYSKYISTTNTGVQNATAAKWGYVVTANADKLFGDTYKMKEATTATVDGTGTIVVQGTADANIVAPGTAGSMTISVSGGSEVLAQLKITTTLTSEIFCGNYYPIVWTLNNGVTDVVTDATFSALNTALAGQTIKATWNDGTKLFELSSSFTLSWKWAYNDTTTPEGREASAKDTLIGYKANGTTWDNIKNLKCATGATFTEFLTANTDITYDETKIKTLLSFEVVATVEQIQA